MPKTVLGTLFTRPSPLVLSESAKALDQPTGADRRGGRKMSRARSLAVAVSAMAMLAAAACGGGADGDSDSKGSDSTKQDSRPRAKPGYVEVRRDPVEVNRQITPKTESFHAPYLEFHLDSLGTLQKLRTDDGALYPAKGETFYVANLEARPDPYTARNSAQPDPDSGDLQEFPYAGVETSDLQEPLDLDSVQQSILKEDPQSEEYTIIAAGKRQSPPKFKIGDFDREWSHEVDLTNGRMLARSAAIKPVNIDLPGSSYEDTVEADLPVDSGAKLTNKTDFKTARISSFSPLGAFDQKNNIVTVDTELRFDIEGTDRSEIGFVPAKTAKLVDNDGTSYPATVDDKTNDNEFIKIGDGAHVQFMFSVPRGASEFTLVYRPLTSFADTSDIQFAPKEISVDFAVE